MWHNPESPAGAAFATRIIDSTQKIGRRYSSRTIDIISLGVFDLARVVVFDGLELVTGVYFCGRKTYKRGGS